MDRKQHWENVYREKSPLEVSWYQARPTLSLELIRASGLGPGARILDVGGGASTLVDHLVAEGFRDITVLDIAQSALEAARRRLGETAGVTWLVCDITEGVEGGFDLWHDRAVFHFLTDPEDRRRYVDALEASLSPGGEAIIATFSPEGPERCSGLPVRRYSPEALAETLGKGFELLEAREESHVTPRNAFQHFVYCRFRRIG